jgi:hypothetical protein
MAGPLEEEGAIANSSGSDRRGLVEIMQFRL